MHYFKKISNISIILSIIIFLASCTERIDINVGTTYTRLAVEGYITSEEGRQWVKLSKTGDYFDNELPHPVTGANVIVENETEKIIFSEDSANPGLYNAPDGFVGEQGVEYTLEIDLQEEINESSKYMANELMPLAAEKIDSIALEYLPDFEIWFVKLYAQEPPTEDFYMFNGYVNGKMITDTASRKNISDDRLFNGNYTAGAIVMVVREIELKEGDIFTLELSNITKGYADYMTELQTELQPSNPLFSGPPANVSSNVDNDAVGYFACYPSLFASALAKKNDK